MVLKKINEIFNIEKGSLQSTKKIPGTYNFITASKEWSSHINFTHDCEALVFASSASGSLGRTHYVNGKFIASDLCYILTPKYDEQVDMSFYWFVFNFIKENIVEQTATGTSKLAINRNNFINYKIPYFNIKHQKKCKQKLLNMDQLKNYFNSNLSKELFYIKKLRQAILQEAIEGKLTADWRKEHPELINGENRAENLLKKIKEEKENLIRENKIKKKKPFPPITENEKPFELPKGWAWCRLNDVSDNIHYGFTASAMPNVKEPKLLRITDIQNDKVNWINVPGCKIETNEIKKYLLSEGDILVARTGGTIGKSFQIDNLQYEAIFASYLIRIIVNNLLNKKYIKYFMQSRLYWIQLDKMSWGSGQPNVNATNLKKMIFPLPPFDEQELIINRIGNLMDIIDNLEKNIDHQKKMSDQLTQSLLREAFEQNI
jgi:type I restriction enzyme, S subunit